MSQVTGSGSANAGTGDWWGQRLSAVALTFLGLWFALSLIAMPGFDHADAFAFIAAPINVALLLLLCVSLAYHSYLGVQVIIEDYVHGPRIHVASLILSRVAHGVFCVVAVYSILKIGFGT